MSLTKPDQLDFSLILASIVHDLKNGIALLGSQFESYLSDNPPSSETSQSDAQLISLELSRLNAGLVQLLGLYKIDKDQISLNKNLHCASELVEDIIAEYELLTERKGIQVELKIYSDDNWLFDDQLMHSVISNLFTNAIRYTKKKLTVEVSTSEQLTISISDDGNGFPDNMLNTDQQNVSQQSHATSTQLGIFFARTIIAMHGGRLNLSNSSKHGGGLVTIILD